MLYLIICETNEMMNDYSSLYEDMKRLSADIRNPLKNVWFIQTEELSAKEIYKKVDSDLYFGDRCLVLCMDDGKVKSAEGDMDSSFWNWLSSRMGFGIHNAVRFGRQEAFAK